MMNNSPLVSIVVVCYRQSRFVEMCLDSVLTQTYTNWELIVADDASPDDSVNTINAWLQKHNVSAKKNFHTQNIGFCRTLNECLELCDGRYIKLFAADDVMLPDLIQKSVDALETSGPAYGACYSRARYFNETGMHDELHTTPELPEGEVFETLMGTNFVPALSVLLRKEAVKNVGGFSLEFLVEDYDYWLKIAEKYKFAFVNEVLSLYRIHGNNTSNTLAMEDEVLRIQIHHDASGKFRQQIKTRLRDIYYQKKVSEKLKKKYAGYPYRHKWLSFSINQGLPYKLFRLVDKTFHF